MSFRSKVVAKLFAYAQYVQQVTCAHTIVDASLVERKTPDVMHTAAPGAYVRAARTGYHIYPTSRDRRSRGTNPSFLALASIRSHRR